MGLGQHAFYVARDAGGVMICGCQDADQPLGPFHPTLSPGDATCILVRARAAPMLRFPVRNSEKALIRRERRACCSLPREVRVYSLSELFALARAIKGSRE